MDFFADGVLAGADGFGSEIGVTASAKAAGEFGAELELHAEHGALQGSGIGIQRDQLGAGQPLESDGVENVGACPAQSNDGDGKRWAVGGGLLAGEIKFNHGRVGALRGAVIRRRNRFSV